MQLLPHSQSTNIRVEHYRYTVSVSGVIGFVSCTANICIVWRAQSQVSIDVLLIFW